MKKRFPYEKSNAFSAGGSDGNPAACLYLDTDRDLTDERMPAIAKERNGFVSEAVHCRPTGEGSYRLCCYSSEREVEFCGHGTIACVYDPFRSREELKKSERITVRTDKGDLTIYSEWEKLDAVFITAPQSACGTVPILPDEIAHHLGAGRDRIDRRYPVASIDAGLKTPIVPVESLVGVTGLRPDEARLKTAAGRVLFGGNAAVRIVGGIPPVNSLENIRDFSRYTTSGMSG